MRPCTEPAITDNQIGSNSSWMVWEQRQSIALRIPVQPLSMEQPLLALLTLEFDSIYANLGAGGFWVMRALCGEALPLVRGLRRAD